MNGMGKAFRNCLVILGCLLATALQAEESAPKPPAQPAIEELGNGQYRIGSILIDKNQASFTVPGVVIQLQNESSPLEFIAGTKAGYKNYESLFEMDTSAVEFNLACILLGLDATHATHPERHFDPKPLSGDLVSIEVSWQEGEKHRRMPVTDVLRLSAETAASNEWVYTGSYFGAQGHYMADVAGTLVGFVHDPESIIQHRTGLGVGNYGGVTYNPEVLPKPGTPIQLHIQRITSAGAE